MSNLLKNIGLNLIILGIVFKEQNVAFMVGLAFAIAASTNFPILILSITWQGLTSKGALYGGISGLFSSVLFVILGPIVWVDIFGFEHAIFPYKYPAIFSVSIAFAVIYIVSKFDKESKTKKHEQNFNKMYTSSYINLD